MDPIHPDSHRHVSNPLHELAEQVDLYHQQAKVIGRMLNDHDPLECPGCGLFEDVLADMRVVTVHPDQPDQDTGLLFEALDEVGSVWLCPGCGGIITSQNQEIS